VENRPPASILPARRILVRGVNWLGDAVMSTPALLRLRERFPGAHITLLTPGKLRDLWLNHPAIDEVITFEAGEGVFTVASRIKLRFRRGSEAYDEPKQHVVEVGKSLQGRDLAGALDSARRALSSADPVEQRKFDLALVLPNSPRSALEVWLANIPRRIGYARPWRSCFLTHCVAERAGAVRMHKRSVREIKTLIAGADPEHGTRPSEHAPRHTHHAPLAPAPPAAHHIHEYLHLTAALGANPEPLAPQLFVTPGELAAVETKFGLDVPATGGRPLLALIPGAEYGPAKRWPLERFIAAAREIRKRMNCVWLILGAKADAEIQRAAGLLSAENNFRQDAGSTLLNLMGKTSLRELMAVLKLCRVVLTNDTGPMHVAAALGTPVVVPFGSTSPELTGPGLPGDPHHRLLRSEAPCSPCFLRECPIDFRCMTGIRVERVVEAVWRVANSSSLEP
jgi:heptosyltransferase-2